MKPRVYLETTAPGYLTAWPSRDLIRAAHPQLTREWWDHRRVDYDVVVSRLVVQECQAGDPGAAAARVATLHDLPMLAVTDAAIDLARELVAAVPSPPRAEADAFRIPANLELHAHRQRYPPHMPRRPQQPGDAELAAAKTGR